MTPPARHPASFLWGAAEASLFFIVPDVLLGWIALRHGLRSAVLASLFAAAGAMAGGAAIHAWSAVDPRAAQLLIEAVPAIPSGAVEQARADMRAGPWVLRATRGAFANRPFKTFAAAAPHAGIGPAAFVAATPLIRLPRFLVVSFAFAAVGAWLRTRLTPRRQLALYGAAWALFYALFWLLSPW